MFIGHFAVAFAAKPAAPSVSLGTLFFACQWVDLVWPLFLLAGLERVEITPGITAFTPLDFVHYPWTHSLVMGVVWAAAFGLLYLSTRGNGKAALIVAAVVLSHWFLDLVAHRPDLPLAPGSETRWGLGLWNSIPATLLVEVSLFVAGVVLYVQANPGPGPDRALGIVGAAAISRGGLPGRGIRAAAAERRSHCLGRADRRRAHGVPGLLDRPPQGDGRVMAHYDFTMPVSEDAVQATARERHRHPRGDAVRHPRRDPDPHVRPRPQDPLRPRGPRGDPHRAERAQGEAGARKPAGYEPVCVGTTTSDRMERFTRPLMAAVRRADHHRQGRPALRFARTPSRDLGGVYLAIIGGTAALETTWIEAIEDVDLDDLNPESLWKFRVKGFGPLLVAMDSHGGSLYAAVKDAAQQRRADALRLLGVGHSAGGNSKPGVR